MSEYLKKMRAALTTKSGELDAIINLAEAENRELTADEVKQVDEIGASIESIEKSIEAEERRQAIKARSSEPSNTPTDGDGQRRVPAAPDVKMTSVQKMGLLAMASAAAAFSLRDNDPQSAVKHLEAAGFQQFADAVQAEKARKMEFMKTLNASTNISGGFLTPDMQAADIIELLYPVTTFLQGGPRIVSMPNGVYRQPAGASGATASYRQEGGKISSTEPTFREVNLSSKFLGAIVPMTRQMVDFTLPGAQAFVEGDLREAMGQAMDSKAYYGSGGAGEPTGLFLHSGITDVATPADSPTLAQIDTFFKTLRLAFLNNNLRSGNWVIVMAPRVIEFLATRRTGDAADGQYAYPEIRGDNPRFGRTRVLDSTNFPINLDTSGAGYGDETDIAIINFSDVLLGNQGEIAMATSSEASVTINGSLVSAFENDLVFLRAISAHDIGLRRPESVALARKIRWGN